MGKPAEYYTSNEQRDADFSEKKALMLVKQITREADKNPDNAFTISLSEKLNSPDVEKAKVKLAAHKLRIASFRNKGVDGCDLDIIRG